MGEQENGPWLRMRGEAEPGSVQSAELSAWRPPGEAEPNLKAAKEGQAGKNPHLKA